MALDISNMLSKTIILVDTRFVGIVAEDFSLNFGKILNRNIPNADLALWLECVALDGGIEPGDNEIQVIFIYENNSFQNFEPSNISKDIDGKAFKGNLGEFTMEAYKVEPSVTTIGEQMAETLRVLTNAEKVENILVVPNMARYGDEIKKVASKNEGKQITIFSIEPQEGEGFSNMQLGFSVVHALGISGDEMQ